VALHRLRIQGNSETAGAREKPVLSRARTHKHLDIPEHIFLRGSRREPRRFLNVNPCDSRGRKKQGKAGEVRNQEGKEHHLPGVIKV